MAWCTSLQLCFAANEGAPACAPQHVQVCTLRYAHTQMSMHIALQHARVEHAPAHMPIVTVWPLSEQYTMHMHSESTMHTQTHLPTA
jgi:hypothetical protein